MARVVCFQVPSIEMWIPSGDHSPPHFHARKPEWHVRVSFLKPVDSMIQLIRPKDAKIRGVDRRAIINGAKANRVALLAEWEACQS